MGNDRDILMRDLHEKLHHSIGYLRNMLKARKKLSRDQYVLLISVWFGMEMSFRFSSRSRSIQYNHRL